MPLTTRFTRGAALTTLLCALLWKPAPAALLTPTPLAGTINLFAPPAADTLASATMSSAKPHLLASSFLQTWADPALAWLWNRRADPSLTLASWDKVFNVARLGVFVVPLRDDPAERANILLAAQSVDGAVIAPGATFSFNDVVGERTTLKGYQEGLMYDAGHIVRGTGGGICLVSTALYNAALQAGMDVLERHPHSGVVSYAAPGCDAAVVYGQEDMQFVNTSGQPLIVSSRIEPDRIVVGLYGAPFPDNVHVMLRTTHLETFAAPTVTTPDASLPPLSLPQIIQKPHDGYNVTVERLWTVGTRVLRREVIASEHRAPRPKIVHIPVPAPAEESAPALLVPPIPGAEGPLSSAPTTLDSSRL